MKRLCCAAALLCLVLAGPTPAADPKVLSITKIWDEGEHNAFTDLIRWRDKWYCSFRESAAHVGGDGRLRVLESADGQQWQSIALLAEAGIDLRDPKLSVTPDDRLMITAGGSVYKGKELLGRQPRVAFSRDGREWTTPQRVLEKGEWLWRVTWHGGRAYGVSYNAFTRGTPAAQQAAATGKVEPGPADWKLKLVSSQDGVHFDLITQLDVPGHPNETTLRFLPDGEMVALVRREGGNQRGWIGRSRAPYREWTWKETEHRLGGPNFRVLPNGQLWAAGRSYPGGAKTVVARMTAEGGYEPALTLPSGGDTSYPGLVWHDGRLWMSYYSTHEGKSAIYLAQIQLPVSDQAAAPGRRTPLDDYVQTPDPTYAWSIAKSIPGNPSQTFVIDLKSQAWRTEKDVDRSVWQHWLVVVVPEKRTTNKAFLLIGGGSNDRPAPDGADAIATAIARATGSVVAELRMVPNQPLVFHGDGEARKEDNLIGYAWDQFLKTGDATWLPRLPMVKSVVKAMDCLQEWSAQQGFPIQSFVVGGGSKRGWTTWMTGAADRRVEAIVPIVIDVVNLEPSIRHHAEVYGFWATAIGDYYRHGILQQPDHPRMRTLYEIVDPYYYRDRLTMPKYIVNASGDQFFCPDSSQFYFDDLQGEKLMRYVPNADHSLRESDAVEGIIAFYQMIIAGRPRPEFIWTFESDQSIRVRSQTPPQRVLVWQAHNPKSRDFRKDTLGNAFTSQTLTAEADGSYVARVPTPERGWTAFFVELAYDAGGPLPLKVSTAVRVLPDKLPFAGIDPGKVRYEQELPKP